MKERDKAKEQLINELERLRRRVSDLEESEARLKETERLLRESEERFRLLYENAPLAYQSLDENGCFLEVNQAWLEMLGYSRDEVIGKWCGDFLSLSYKEKFTAYFPQFKAAGEIHGVEFELVKKDGSTILISVDGKIGRDRQGQFQRTHCILHDVTDTKKEAEELRKSEREFRTLAENLPDIVARFDPEDRYVYVNPMMERALGIPAEALIGKVIGQARIAVRSPENLKSAELLRASVRRVWEADSAMDVEVVWPLTDGEHVFECRLVPEHDATGAVSSVLGIGRDITAAKRAEERLQLLNFALDHVREAAYLIDENTRFLYVNDEACRALRYSRKEILGGMSVLDIVPGLTERRWSSHWRELKAHGSLTFEAFHETKDGHVFPVEIAANIFRYDGIDYNVALARDITERKQVETELQRSNDLLRAIIEAAPTAIIGLDLDGNVQHVWNQAAEKMLGWKAQEVMGRPLPSVPSESQEEFRRFREWIRSGKSLNGVEVRRQRRDGTFINYSIYASPLRDAEGAIKGNIAVMVDMTERNRAEAALRESEERFRTAFDTHPDAIALLELEDLKYADVNGGFTKLSGYDKWQVIGRSAREVNILLEPEEVSRALEKLNENGYLENFETTLHLRDGRLIAGLLAARFMTIKGIPHILAIARNIEDWKRAEKDRSRLITAIEQACETVVITDPEGTILYANPAFERVTGFPRDKVIGGNPRILKSGQHDQAFYHNLWRTIRSGKVWSGHFVNKRRDGSLYEEEATISPIKDESGKIVNYVAVKRDVTGEVLLKKQLLEAQKMEAVGTLAGGVAHDFNNLLQVILGYAEMALMAKDMRKSLSALREIRGAARSAAELTQALLTFSRRVESKLRPIDLNHELQQLARMLRRTIPKMIEIEMTLSDDLHAINADPGQLQQIVLNLAVNARDAMPDRGRIIIETKNVFLDDEYCESHIGASPGHHVLLTFSDTGCGMDEETAAHVFEPFFTTKEAGKGTGLGLSVVFGIVKNHGGNILCDSQPGKGTTFRIYLPALGKHQQSLKDEQGWTPTGGNETILLVDDETSIRLMTRSMLESFGYTVLQASNGREALEIFCRERHRISLVILDLIMPEIGGKECLQEILRLAPETKTIIASGYAADGQIDRALEGGAKACVRKPFDMRQILRTIREVLDQD